MMKLILRTAGPRGPSHYSDRLKPFHPEFFEEDYGREKAIITIHNLPQFQAFLSEMREDVVIYQILDHHPVHGECYDVLIYDDYIE